MRTLKVVPFLVSLLLVSSSPGNAQVIGSTSRYLLKSDTTSLISTQRWVDSVLAAAGITGVTGDAIIDSLNAAARTASTQWTFTTAPKMVGGTTQYFAKWGADSTLGNGNLRASGNNIVFVSDAGKAAKFYFIDADDGDTAGVGIDASGNLVLRDENYGWTTLSTILASVGSSDSAFYWGITGSGSTSTDTLWITATSPLTASRNAYTLTLGIDSTLLRDWFSATSPISFDSSTGIISFSSTYAGNTSLVTLGTVTTGSWHGDTLEIAYGGTGAVTANTALNNLLPSQTGNAGKFFYTNGTNTSWQALVGSGTVTNIGMTVPSILSVTPAAITTADTFELSLATQTANYFWLGPASGAAATPTFRAVTWADLNGAWFDSLARAYINTSGLGAGDALVYDGTEWDAAASVPISITANRMPMPNATVDTLNPGPYFVGDLGDTVATLANLRDQVALGDSTFYDAFILDSLNVGDDAIIADSLGVGGNANFAGDVTVVGTLTAATYDFGTVAELDTVGSAALDSTEQAVWYNSSTGNLEVSVSTKLNKSDVRDSAAQVLVDSLGVIDTTGLGAAGSANHLKLNSTGDTLQVAASDTAGLAANLAAKLTGAAFDDSLARGNTMQVFNVKASPYNAVGNGVADDDAAIIAAVAAARAVKGTVYFPTGRYVYRTTIVIDTAGMRLIGDGKYSTYLMYHGDGTQNAIIAGDYTEVGSYHLELANFTIVPDSALSGIETKGVMLSTIHDVMVGPATPAAAVFFTNGIHMKRGMINDLRNITISGYSGNESLTPYGIVLDTVAGASVYTTTVTISNPHINYTGTAGIYFTNGASYCKVLGGASEGNTGWGMKLDKRSGLNTIDGVDFEGNTLGAIYIDSCQHNSILNVNSDGIQLFGLTYGTRIAGTQITEFLKIGVESYSTTLENVKLFPNASICLDSSYFGTTYITSSGDWARSPQIRIEKLGGADPGLKGIVAADTINGNVGKFGSLSGTVRATAGILSATASDTVGWGAAMAAKMPKAQVQTKEFTVLDTVKVGGEVVWAWKVPYAITITEISGFTDANTTTFNIEQRAEATPNTAGTDCMAADLAADSDQQEQTSFDDATVPANTWLVCTVSATGDVAFFAVTIRYTVD